MTQNQDGGEAAVRAYFEAPIAEISPEERQAIANLAAVQVTAEELMAIPSLTQVLIRPADAAGMPALKALLGLLAERGTTPDPTSTTAYAQLLAAGTYIRWPPTPEGQFLVDAGEDDEE